MCTINGMTFRTPLCISRYWGKKCLPGKNISLSCQSGYLAFRKRINKPKRLRIIAKWLSASSCLSVCTHGTIRLTMDGFSLNWYFSIFWKSVERIQVSLKFDRNNVYFMCRPIGVFIIISRSFLFRIGNVSDISRIENQNKHFPF